MAWIGPTLEDPFSQGVQAGLNRAAQHDLVDSTLDWVVSRVEPDYVERSPVREVLEQPLEVTRGLLEREEISGRFIELFAEMVTVAVIARRAYRDLALTESDIESYLQQSYSIFNSFRHA
jgi:hypothetical protein